MDWVVNYSNFGPADIKAVNYCRLYFNVVTVSDITNAQGTHIDEHYWSGKDSEIRNHTTWHKRLQDKPASAKSWGLWRKALHLFAHGNRQLDNPLGKWLYTPENQRTAWPFYYDPIGSTFYRRNNDTFLAYLGNGRKHPNTTPITTTNLPETSVPVDVALPPNTANDVPAAIDTIRTW
jgi:hypothetical protein